MASRAPTMIEQVTPTKCDHGDGELRDCRQCGVVPGSLLINGRLGWLYPEPPDWWVEPPPLAPNLHLVVGISWKTFCNLVGQTVGIGPDARKETRRL